MRLCEGKKYDKRKTRSHVHGVSALALFPEPIAGRSLVTMRGINTYKTVIIIFEHTTQEKLENLCSVTYNAALYTHTNTYTNTHTNTETLVKRGGA